MESSWQSAAAKKRDELNALIPPEWRISHPPSNIDQPDVTGAYIHQFLDEKEIAITETDAVGIAENIASRTWTAVDVTRAFCHRAALAHQLTNCLLEIFFDAGLQQAKELDERLKSKGELVGPLHGVPVSLKDQLHVRGVETTMGYVGWIGNFQGGNETLAASDRTFESELVKELRALGAVLYCKTSVPHTLMTGETVNNIVGYCWNPKNRHLSAGGSSGGEGALIGLRGSPVGFGTDIGGSIRIPAAFNGLYGIRPSTGRMPYEGASNTMDGQNTVLSVIGPLATTARSLKFMFQAILSQQPWWHDPMVHEIPWRHELEQQALSLASGKTGRLALGVFRNDGTVTPHPPVLRALDIVCHTLEKLGHEVFEWKPPPHAKLLELAFTAWDMDGGEAIRQDFAKSGESMSPQIAHYEQVQPQMTAIEIAKLNVKIRAAKKEYLDYWNSTSSTTATGRPADAFIAPVAPFPAATPNAYRYYGYTTIVNVLDYTSVVVPVTLADKEVDKAAVDFEPRSEDDKEIQKLYDPRIFDGAHVSVQLVGRRLEEEKMLALAEYLSAALQK